MIHVLFLVRKIGPGMGGQELSAHRVATMLDSIDDITVHVYYRYAGPEKSPYRAYRLVTHDKAWEAELSTEEKIRIDFLAFRNRVQKAVEATPRRHPHHPVVQNLLYRRHRPANSDLPWTAPR